MLFSLLVCLPLLCLSQNGEPIITSKMGLVAYLVSIKMNTESVASMILSDTILIKQKEKKEILEEYNNLRIISIPLITQLIADISKRNSLKIYKKLDQYFTENDIANITLHNISDSRLSRYIENLKSLDDIFRKFYTKAYRLTHIPVGNPRVPAVGDITGIFTLIETAVKDLSDAKGKKADKIIAILDAIKIVGANELLNPSDTKK